MEFLEMFSEVPDPRDFTAQHPLAEILFIALAAVLCGATNCTEMVYFAEARLELLREFIPLERGVPSHDTFSRVLRALDPAAFNAVFMRFMASFGEQARCDQPRGQLAVDGKSLRRAYDKGRAHMPPLMVTVFACDTFMSLAQTIAEKGGRSRRRDRGAQAIVFEGLYCHRRCTALSPPHDQDSPRRWRRLCDHT